MVNKTSTTLGHELINRVIMALKTAIICEEKGERRVGYTLKPFDACASFVLAPDGLADCSGFSVLRSEEHTSELQSH